MIQLHDFDAVMMDLDGTLWHEFIPIPGAAELVRSIRKRGQKYGFVSNTGVSPARVRQRLADMDILADENQILTAAAAGCDYVLHTFGNGCRVLNVANDSVQELLTGKVQFVNDAESPCDAVVVAGLSHPLSGMDRQQIALMQLMKGAKLVALCADRAYPTHGGFELGAGAVASMLAYGANVTPAWCGKPEAWFFLDLCKRLDVDPWKCVLIGDNLESDIAGSKKVGMKSILTLTGLSTRISGEAAAGDQKPDRIIHRLEELLQ